MRGPTPRDGNGKADRSVWFVYRRTANEFTASPVNAKGWLALIGCIVATGIVALGSSLLIARLSPWAIAVTIPVSVFGGIWLTLRLTKRRGREIR